MNNVKFEHKKTGEVVIVKVCQPSASTLSRHWNYRTWGGPVKILTLPTLARAHTLMLAKGFVRVNRKPH